MGIDSLSEGKEKNKDSSLEKELNISKQNKENDNSKSLEMKKNNLFEKKECKI